MWQRDQRFVPITLIGPFYRSSARNVGGGMAENCDGTKLQRLCARVAQLGAMKLIVWAMRGENVTRNLPVMGKCEGPKQRGAKCLVGSK